MFLISSKMKCSKLNYFSIIAQRYKSEFWSSQKIRRTFIDYFKNQNHVFVPSSSVISKKYDGSYFVNSGMNQFKSIFTGNMDASESDFLSLGRVTNYQKCIRIGGKHNDLDDVGYDFYHHTFFEMLGNWSFNNSYSKHEACKMAWELLTQVYNIPPSHLYITYFSGDSHLNLTPDLECRDIWRSLGVREERILPFGIKDNFWSMGATGPCGPCTEIHYCFPEHLFNAGVNEPSMETRDYEKLFDSDRYKLWVNAGREEVKEVWNLVFMQYDKHKDDSLHRLPQEHIDTGMGLERLTAILQHKLSNYDTDLFVDMFSHIKTFAKCPPYGGSLKDKRDIAYRIIADHARMATVCICDGLIPGRRNSAGKLRQVMYRGQHQLSSVLDAPKGFMASLVPLLEDSLADAYPEIASNVHLLRDVMNETEERYNESVKVGRKVMKKAMKTYQGPLLTGEQILSIQEGKFGKAVPLDMIEILAKEFAVQLDLQGYHEICMPGKTSVNGPFSTSHMAPLSQQDIKNLKNDHIDITDDSYKYNRDGGVCPDIEATVVAIKSLQTNQFVNKTTTHNGDIIITDKSNFYAEAGGQKSDEGVFYSGGTTVEDRTPICRVHHTAAMKGYVCHYIDDVTSDICVGDKLGLSIDQNLRAATTRNHTATHLIQNSLNEVLGGVVQQGSSVKPDHLTFEFTSFKSNVTLEDLKAVAKLLDDVVLSDVEVHRSTRLFSEVHSCKHISRLDAVYPSKVTVVSIGVEPGHVLDPSSQSVELCGGTHVEKTGQLGKVVVTNFEGSIQGVKRLTAVTGKRASKAVKNAEKINRMISEVKKSQNQQENLLKLKEIDKLLVSNMLLGKVEREAILEEMKVLTFAHSQSKNRLTLFELFKDVSLAVHENTKEDFCVFSMRISKLRSMVRCLVELNYNKPIFIIADHANPNLLGLCYVPQKYKAFSSLQWIENICSSHNGQYSVPQGKLSHHTNICLFTIASSDNDAHKIENVLKSAESFVLSRLKKYSNC